MSDSEIKEILERLEILQKGYQPIQEGSQPIRPTLVNPDRPDIQGGYQPIVSEKQTPKLPPTKK
jgi:hypothetical protein